MAISTAVDLSAVARVVGIQTNFVNLRQGIAFLPQRVAILGQGASATTYPLTKLQITSAAQAGSVYGFGSPIHLVARQLFPANGDGVGSIPVTVYPLADDGAGVAATGNIAITGAATGTLSARVRIGNIRSEAFLITSTSTLAQVATAMAAAINAVLDMPVIAVADTTPASEGVDLTSKWQGASANGITIVVDDPTSVGLTFGVTDMASGATNPDVDAALALVGNVWETMLLNCMDAADEDTMDKIATFGEGRWGALTRKPMVSFFGNTATSVASATAITSTRTTDRTNVQLVAPASPDLPFVVAARQLARIARVANSSPARDYGSQQATGITAGPDGDQWDYIQRDQAVKAGSSTIEVRDGVVNVSDTITMYAPAGDPTPAYRYVCDIVKLQNILFNLDLEFVRPQWDGAPLIPDDQATINPDARKPKDAVSAIASIVSSLGLNAIISDTETAIGTIQAEIDAMNPKRLNAALTVALSGNANIISVDLNFGFFFGTPAIL